MTTADRRTILRALGGAAVGAAFPETISKALAIPANNVTGTIQDIEHIVILMQENRSFDHYFGTLRGVRGYSDPRAVTLSTGNPVYFQPAAAGNGVVLPFHPTAAGLGLQFLGDLPHGWSDAHGAWNNGNNDRWVKNKGTETMAYMQRADVPFHYALADAFTICDAYHCSTMTSTDPNRYYMWTGWLGQNGTGPNDGSVPGTLTLGNNGDGVPPFGPVIANTEAGYSWTTYPERLQDAGISWKIYQDIGIGLNAAGSWGWTSNAYIGNFGDTSTLYFLKYQNATPGNPLYDLSRTGTNLFNGGGYNGGTFFDILKSDVLANKLPAVSWIVAPEAYSEHPNWPANYGAWYTANVISALTSNPAVWSKTALFICFDENDGFFDHIVPATAPMSAAQGLSTVSTVNEIYPGKGSKAAGPYGLGARVPMLVISPWSKGGWVCSEVFDHSSLIRFIEQRFGVKEPNITPWRRTVCGDLTSAFDFTVANSAAARLPSTTGYLPPSGDIPSGKRYPSYIPTPPANQAMPVQEPGLRLARPLPYTLQADGVADIANQRFGVTFANAGKAGAWFHARTANGSSAGGSTGPWGYTVEAGKTLSDNWTPANNLAYDLSIYGPNGFFRKFAGNLGAAAANLQIQTVYQEGGVSLIISNAGTVTRIVSITDRYTGKVTQQTLTAGASFQTDWALDTSYNWYDFTIATASDPGFLRQVAGHVETGANSVSDPLI